MLLESVILFMISGASFLYFFHQNKNRRIERFYFKENKLLYASLMFVNFILLVTMALNSRVIMGELFLLVVGNWKPYKQLMKLIKK